MISQSFLYNAIFFTYTLVLGKFYGVASEAAPLYLIAFAVGNLAGPLTLGHLFDTIGRRKMIAGTYVLSGLLLAASAVLFNAGLLNAITQTIAWCVIFYFASAGASAAYLTVSEIFPLEVRAKAIAVFFAIAQCFGALSPVIYGALIGDGSQPFLLFLGYLLGAGVMAGLGNDAAIFLCGREQFPGMRPAGVGLPQPGQHAGEFGDPFVVVEPAHPAGAVAAERVDHQMRIGVGGDLRQVGDDDDLVGARQTRQATADLHRGATTDARVHLVEHHRGAFGRRCQHDFQRQHHPGQLAAGRALVQRQHRAAAVCGEAEVDLIHTRASRRARAARSAGSAEPNRPPAPAAGSPRW